LTTTARSGGIDDEAMAVFAVIEGDEAAGVLLATAGIARAAAS
jgi:hypothetical protein